MSSDLRTAIIENITIADFLRSEGYEVIPRGRKLTVKGHDSLVITPEKMYSPGTVAVLAVL